MKSVKYAYTNTPYFNSPVASDHVFLLLDVCVPVYICFTVTNILREEENYNKEGN